MASVDPLFPRREGNRYVYARTGADVSVPRVRFERPPKRDDVERKSRRGFRIVDEPDPLPHLAILIRAYHD